MNTSERPFMEHALSTQIGDVLPHMQHRIMTQTSWMGVTAYKSPLDAWVYQELLHELRPTTIIEIGVFHGGSTLYLAHLCDLLGVGRILAVDATNENVHPRVLEHERVMFFHGEAVSLAPEIAGHIDDSGHVLVIEDSAHTYDNTLGVCRTFGKFVTPGSYLIVEDTICHHGLDVGPDPGPYEAAAAFVEESPEFVVRRDLEGFVITWNPTGFLQRVE